MIVNENLQEVKKINKKPCEIKFLKTFYKWLKVKDK